MLHRRFRTVYRVLLVSAAVTVTAAVPAAAQIRTVDIPASQPAPMLPAPEAEIAEASEIFEAPEAPEAEASDGLDLALPTIEEARAIDADAADAVDTADALAQPIGDPAAIDVDAAAQAIAAAEAARLRAANSEQLEAARQQLDRIGADKQAERDRLARYREAEAAHAAMMADYDVRLEAARAARLQWERDVAACRAGDRSRCGPPVVPN